MIVVADTGPINYLCLVGVADVLPALFGTLLIPEAVRRELRDPLTPQPVREWMDANAQSVETRTADGLAIWEPLDPGEREAIALALTCGADVLLVDDAEARAVAKRNGVRVLGTVGILEMAAARGLVDLPASFERLQQTNFRISERILKDALDRQRDATSNAVQ